MPADHHLEASKHVPARLVMQFRIERAVRRVGLAAIIIFVLVLILSVPEVDRLLARLT